MQKTDEEVATEYESRHNAKLEVARKLADVLQYAVRAGLENESSLIARLIEATLTGKTINLLNKLYS